jgi:hypothetical protein
MRPTVFDRGRGYFPPSLSNGRAGTSVEDVVQVGDGLVPVDDGRLAPAAAFASTLLAIPMTRLAAQVSWPSLMVMSCDASFTPAGRFG